MLLVLQHYDISLDLQIGHPDFKDQTSCAIVVYVYTRSRISDQNPGALNEELIGRDVHPHWVHELRAPALTNAYLGFTSV